MTDKTREAIEKLLADHLYHFNVEANESKQIAYELTNRISDIITAQADGVTDDDIEAEAGSYCAGRFDYHSDERKIAFAAFIESAYRLRSKLAQPKTDGCVTDDDIQAEALSYASKPLAPYLRSEVFADGAKWLRSKLKPV